MEMWNELKFAINWNAGDTKPIRQGRNSSRSTINNNKNISPSFFIVVQVEVAVNVEQEQR